MDGPVSTTQNGAPVIGLRGAGKTYATGRGELVAVAPTTLDIAEGEFFGIIGFSGAGKSTLLRLINRLEDPTEGQVLVDGVDLTRLDKRSLRAARRSTGMIFQQFNLLSNRTTVGNVEFPLEVAGVPRAERRGRAMAALELVGLADKASEHPARLSGGQKQRVGIARALVNDPKVLLCDEPTSALDPHTTLALLKSLKRIREDLGVTIVIVTHEINVVRYVCDRVAIMDSGRVVELLDMRATDIEPRSGLGRFLFATADGYRDDIDPYVGEEEG